MANKIAIRTDTAANWASNNPTLEDGEQGYETDTGRRKIGNGSTAWTSLNYTDTVPPGVTEIDDGDSPYTVLATDQTIYVDASGGAVTVTLPSLTGNIGRRITVRASDATNTITIARAGSDTIANALTSVTLSSDRDYWTLEAGPTQWELVAGYETISGDNDGIKRFDGTMEQWNEDTITVSASSVAFYPSSGTKSFEVSFTETPNIINSNIEGQRTEHWFTCGPGPGYPTATEFILAAGDARGTTRTGSWQLFWEATGRWY